METNYNTVPKILTGKDLDYLSDMFEWNYGALKKTNQYMNNVQNEEIKTTLQNACSLFNNNLQVVLKILGGSNE